MELVGAVLMHFMAFVVNGVFAERFVYNKQANSAVESRGLFPGKVNVAARAIVTANASCGASGPEEFCRLAPGRDQCGICDSRSPDPNKRHLPQFTVDGSDRWWQSPSLYSGSQYEWITITLDLKQEYLVSDVIVKAGISPRPGNWILEKSIDGKTWTPWQYYAVTEDECWSRYGVRPAPPNPSFKSDTEVVCTAYFSKIKPLEGGEIHTNLVSGRPKLNLTLLEEFTKARYVQLRLQKIRASADLLARSHRESTVARKLFYSIRNIIISGQCICNGHAAKCRYSDQSDISECDCEHNTCGPHCETCCPLYNQEEWRKGTARDSSSCQECQCYGHASSCHYDPEVAGSRLSLDIQGRYSGGGVCDNCTRHTTGINCEQCEIGWFRPPGVRPDAPTPCVACNCHSTGSTGVCAKDDSLAHLGKPAGACECRDGYAGLRCEQCAPGYRNFPLCAPCPCDIRGMQNQASCDSRCICKENVEGEKCDACKPGYFLLDRDNPSGCMECYCSGVSSICEAAVGYKLQEVNTLGGWLVSDIAVSRTVLPSTDPESGLLSIGNFELPGVENYFWLAPEPYGGNKLSSYGSTLTFRVAWVVMRGDTSGKPTVGPDVVLVGSNGLRIGFGENLYQQNNISLTVQLLEGGWYHIADDSANLHNRFGFRGVGVSRTQMLSVLADIKHVLLRAKFHTDQAEASLVSSMLEMGVEGSSGTEVTHLERCSCPEGYAGLSCESCAFGYTRIVPDSSSPRQHPVCSKCNCHGHAPTCDPVTGECGKCEHNTTGPMCERCLPGYYGDAQLGNPSDCQRCACPLVDSSNNFSPVCKADSHGYICTQCPLGYQGKHCQECAVGYYGNPMVVGSICRPCECNDGPCDPLTGQCLDCRGNTEGWRCEKCKPAHYGDPVLADCKPCDCNVYGSYNTSGCDEVTGQCECRDKYMGRNCHRCQAGLGNITAGCIPCQCDSVGATSTLCDSVTGHCSCHRGVAGPFCETCLSSHYGFSPSGCKSCDCNIIGSQSLDCDLVTGDCICRSHIIGKTCNICQDGYWGLSQSGCKPCDCDPVGAINSTCDVITGQCICKPGVGGQRCEQCLPLFYGLSTYGCTECEICDKPGHVCDPDTGKCVCPPLTEGQDCSKCQRNSWGFKPGKGCKSCNCHASGSQDLQCDVITGDCLCQKSYQGSQCSQCAHGFYGFPRCQPCDCNLAGTKPLHCPAGTCLCDEFGQCPCKENVIGKHCDRCKDGTFGLQSELSDGCMQCFCFGRSAKCTEAGLTWTQIRISHPRTLSVNYDNNTTQFGPASNIYPVNTQEICYINLAVPGGGELSLNKDITRLNVTNNLRIIPGAVGDVEIGVSFLFDSPVYWELPANFLGDKVLSYGGYLRFTAETEGGTRLLPPAVLASYPLIQIQGNNRLILEHFPILYNPSSRHEVRFHESLWRMKNNPADKVTRDMLMVALQNLQHILIRATDTVDFTTALLRDVTLDTAVASPGKSPPAAHGVELCSCPPQYNSSSCQNPSLGFFRYRGKDTVSSTIIIQLVGEARPCNCNGRSEVCDIETGFCLNCSDSTGGKHCDECAEGHYGDPKNGQPCLPCPCPSPTHNLATSCHVIPGREPVCNCKRGYTGKRCERCSYGWYGFPMEEGGKCVPCECNPHGSVSDECHELTGQCNCRPGITGRDCSQCQPRHILTPKGCTSCDDGCTGLLLDKVDDLHQKLSEKTEHLSGGIILPPWQDLMQADSVTNDLEDTWRLWQNTSLRLQNLPFDADEELHKKARQLLNKAKKLEKNCHNTTVHAIVLREEAEVLLSEIKGLELESKDIVKHLQNYGLSETQMVSVVAALQEARQNLAKIRDSDLEPTANAAVNTLRYCNDTLHDIKSRVGDQSKLDKLHERLDKLVNQIADMKSILHNVTEKSNQVIRLTEQNKGVYKNAGRTVDLTLSFEEDIMKLMKESTDLKNIAYVLLGEAEDNVDALKKSSDDLKNLSRAVEEREGILFNLNPLYKEKYVDAAQKHAADLMEQAQKYADLFVPTRQDADFALKASKAYQDIVDALQSAREAAKNASHAADIAHERAYPGVGRDSLVDEASAAAEESRKLLDNARQQMEHVTRMYDQLDEHKEAVDNLTQNLTAAAHEDNAISRQLQKLNSEEVSKIAEVTLNKADDLTGTATLLQEEVEDINAAIGSRLQPKLEQLDSEGEISLNSAKDMITETQNSVRKAQDLLHGITKTAEKRNQKFSAWNETVTNKLESLRSKITQARHIADGIRLSLTSRGERGGCIRTYQPNHLEPSTMTSIVLTYAISSQQRDALLFYLPSTTTDDFIAIEMVNRKMRFVWNMGGGVGEVTHPLHIQTAGDLSKDQHWYRVEAERISNVGRLMVRPQVLPEGSRLSDGNPVSNVSASGIGRLDVGPGDQIWVGGADRRPPSLLSTQPGLVGCLHHLYLDGRPIGLWNFRTQAHSACTACIEGAEEVKDEQSYTFSGDGYAVLMHDSASAYNKYVFSVSLSFRTFDENALLFLAVGSNPEKSVSLTLSQGHVVFRISYGKDWSLETRTLKQYNNGNWTRVEASRYYDRKKKVEKGVIKVEGEVRDGSPTVPPSQDAIPDLSGAQFFFGGLAPGFKNPSSIPTSFLGCMSDIQVLQEGYNLLKGKFWGVQASCSKKPLTVVGFHGDGFLELISHPLKRKASFGFVFATAQQDALLMLSTFEGIGNPIEEHEEITNIIEQEDRLSYYTVSLRRGQIDVRLNAGRGEVRLASTSSEYGDSQFHSVAVTKIGRRLELRVDDVVHGTATLPEGATLIKAPGTIGGLFFGGLPHGFNTTGRTVSNIPFIGSIKDAIFNDQLLQFNQPVSFNHATIGRMGPSSNSNATQMATMATKGASGCRKVTSYTLQPGAVKFGDSPNTHVYMNFRKRSILQKNFTLEVHFRTFYPDGLIFVVPGARGKQLHYMMGALRNGRLQIILKGRRKVEMTAQAVLNDGAWHHMTLVKADRKMMLRVDAIDPEKTKTPKKINVGPVMYVGGLPDKVPLLPDSLVSKLEGFKGCMQSLRLNDQNEDLVGDKAITHRVGQCFPQVERGSYFPGDAFAIYEYKFLVGAVLELELEFRTSEMNGILLSVSEPDGYPALSLELLNGKVVMAGDMGDRRPFVVEQSFESEYTVCDNRWHRIQANYVNDELTLKVDHLDKTYWLSDNGHLTEAHTNSPLYIGGLPDQAPSGTLKSRENFKGCIRNVMIGGKRRDWIEMAALHNILLSSCPLPS